LEIDTENGAATVPQRTPFFFIFLKFQISKFLLKHINNPSKHVYHTPRRRNPPFPGQEREEFGA
jgi:hypothetical protein